MVLGSHYSNHDRYFPGFVQIPQFREETSGPGEDEVWRRSRELPVDLNLS